MPVEIPQMCGYCGEPVTSQTIGEHMLNQHGHVSSADWRVAVWPDGKPVLLDFSFLRNL